jgi:hypothetical protein
MTKNHFFISVELLQLIHDFDIEWKTINEIWLVEQEKKDKKKKLRFKKSVNDEEDDDLEFIINKFSCENDFIAFENENKTENVLHARHSKHEYLYTNHSIDDEFLSRDFFDDMNDERTFQKLYNLSFQSNKWRFSMMMMMINLFNDWFWWFSWIHRLSRIHRFSRLKSERFLIDFH